MTALHVETKVIVRITLEKMLKIMERNIVVQYEVENLNAMKFWRIKNYEIEFESNAVTPIWLKRVNWIQTKSTNLLVQQQMK